MKGTQEGHMKGTLAEFIEMYKKVIGGIDNMVLIVKDEDCHRAMLYSDGGKIAFQFQDDFSQWIYPEPEYTLIGLMQLRDGVSFVCKARNK
jgi:hypothetical protein